MARALPEWIGRTDDSAVPPRVKLRVWDREDGKCHLCRRDIPSDDAWIIEHRQAIILGGANAEKNLCLTCSWCKPIKDAEDVAAKAKTAAVRSRHLGITPKSVWPSQRLGGGNKQHSATKPLTKGVGLAYFPEETP